MRKSASLPWTEDQDRTLLAMHHRGVEPGEIAQAVGRTLGGVEKRMARLGLLKKAPEQWSSEDIQCLIEMRARGLFFKDIALRLKRTVWAVQQKYTQLAVPNSFRREDARYATAVRCVQRDNVDFLIALRREIGCQPDHPMGLAVQSYRQRCEYDVPPDFRPARTQVSFAASSSLMGSTMAMCSEVA